MTKRIFRSIFLVATVVLLACLVIIMGVLYRYFTTVQENTLAAQTSLAAQGVEKEGVGYFQGLHPNGYRVTWVDTDGTVLYDNEADAATMENHGNRLEIKEALESGVGTSERTSSTLSQKTLYRAERLADGTVLRISVTQYTVFTLVLGMAQSIVLVLAGAIVLSAFLARRLAKKVVEPLNALDLDHPLENDAYEEVSPLLTRIEHQHRQITGQMEELREKQDEFAAVTANMNEGLILINSDGAILSINPAAARLFGAPDHAVGRDILTVNRTLVLQKLVTDAKAGRHSETMVDLPAGTYQLDASPVLSGGTVAGVCLLAFDITEKARAEEQRREFSANVSHELKTPLHTILGSAELIQNGMVKPEDLPRFVEHIRAEAARLVTLVDDIIRLSQLDEGGDLPRETVDLTALAQEAAEALRPAAEAGKITVTVEGEELPIYGVRRLLYEILFNLCDNAIKYNKEGGSVSVRLTKEKNEAVLAVSDTGIGIPPESQERVFERFYRVDKSHSRETGGTGLGLSIVKHAAQAHGAAISLESTPGKGTTITLRFPSPVSVVTASV